MGSRRKPERAQRRREARTGNISVRLSYDGRLWPKREDEFSLKTYKFGNASLSLGPCDARISVDVDIGKRVQRELFVALTEPEPSQNPHWQRLPASVHPFVLQVEDELRAASSLADRCLRREAPALRLPPWSFPVQPANSNNRWSTAQWSFATDEQTNLAELISALDPKYARACGKGLRIPLPNAYKGRHLHLDANAWDRVGAAFEKGEDVPPSTSLFAAARAQWENRAFGPAVAILGVAIETALKWRLATRGDAIAGYLLTNVQSPPLPKLFSCARDHADLKLPAHYKKWLTKLVEARNHIVHKPTSKELKPFEVARWFAMGEAILAAIDGAEPDRLIGCYAEIPPRAEAFPAGTRGVVLRREETWGEDNFHIFVDAGTIHRFSPDAFSTDSP